MYVPADGDGGRDGLDVGLFHEDATDELAEVFDVGFRQVPAFSELGDRIICGVVQVSAVLACYAEV